MKVSVVSLIVAAGATTVVVCAARAAEPGVLSGGACQPTRIAGHIYKAATGERRVTPALGSRFGPPIGENPHTVASGVIGLDMINVFIDDDDGVLDPSGTRAAAITGIHDGVVDFGDYPEFLNLFDACGG